MHPACGIGARGAYRGPVAPCGVHLDDERLALGALLALDPKLVRVHDGREPHVGCEVLQRAGASRRACGSRGCRRRGGTSGVGGRGRKCLAAFLGIRKVRVDAGEDREAVDGAGEDRRAGSIVE